ncbi:MAG: potassium/proton antiporter [Rubrivivax sp.]|jgi:cell volume regulation protein A|nr:potassium/proton antiporter [Rubrivivax sp.]
MDFVNLPLLAAGLLVFVGVLAGLVSARIGLSSLLVFLLVGILAGEDGVVGWRFDDHRLSFWVGNVALAIILLDGGLRTALATFRTGLKPAALLATAGVVVSAAVTALAAVLFLDLDWGTAMLLGAIVGSTDAAAVFALLTRSGVTLNERVAATLEIESGVNDPMAVYLTLAFIAIVLAGDGGSMAGTLVLGFVQQFGWGTLMGLAGGFALALLLPRVARRDAGGGLIALLVGSAGLAVFGATGWLGGSGFLAVYLVGLVLANRAADTVAPALPAMDGYAWMAQAAMFLILGLLVTPTTMLDVLGPGIAIAAVLMLIARPLAVAVCLWPFRFSVRETLFISWVGLRGAVPIVLALFPLLAGVPQASLLFNIAFVVVLVSLLAQGSTIGWAARRLGVALPEPGDEQSQRAVFRDFAVDPSAPVGGLCDFYGLPAPPRPHRTVEVWLADELRRPPVPGDSVRLGTATFVVRAMDGDRIRGVGLGLTDTGQDPDGA